MFRNEQSVYTGLLNFRLCKMGTLWGLFLLFLYLLIPAHTNAESFALKQEMNGEVVTTNIYSLIDEKNTITATEIASGRLDSLLKEVKPEESNIGLVGNSTYWTSFEVKNNSPQDIVWFLSHSIPEIEYFIVNVFDENGNVSVKEAGTLIPPSAKSEKYFYPVVQITTPAGTKQKIIIKNKYELGGVLNLQYSSWSDENFSWHKFSEMWLLGLFYGALVAMFFYNLFIYLLVRDISYLLYVCYLVPMGLCNLAVNGLDGILFNGNVFLITHTPTFYASLALCAAILFTQSFLQTNKNIPKYADWILKGMLTYYALCTLLSLTPLYFTALFLFCTGIIGIPIFLIVGVIAWHRGYKPARYYLLGWTFFIIGSVLYIMQAQGFLPVNLFTVYSGQIGGGVEMLLLSFALADKIRTLRNEKEMAQQLVQETLERSKKELETKVEERTLELIMAKEEADLANNAKTMFLANMSHEIRSPLNSIVLFSRILKDECREIPVPDSFTQFLKNIQISSENMSELISV